ncbi:hypothetical protein GUITHDRAFT_99175 [Guillardia theta CCMP2712]|uniref:Uncharacterized protein n=1 Tax=Guillardia theta (strain CCMP2712) TaxID=905079 RepID=L1K4K7_GUITC|nr:hypothetical protein GUITHDRAFT_99175 [Guillardia theta CCMP2712]EKX55395.1 hypothetical protein GUITHDRAFT_99175 [Guillardia theta CCMP2712]|eukprot:XP_005842375.1 hypothetical protein GUITHDRAFT_99175 [Guillardia theta CCMP2712]
MALETEIALELKTEGSQEPEEALAWEAALFPRGRPQASKVATGKEAAALAERDEEGEAWGISYPTGFKLEARQRSRAIRGTGKEGMLLRSIEEAMRRQSLRGRKGEKKNGEGEM